MPSTRSDEVTEVGSESEEEQQRFDNSTSRHRVRPLPSNREVIVISSDSEDDSYVAPSSRKVTARVSHAEDEIASLLVADRNDPPSGSATSGPSRKPEKLRSKVPDNKTVIDLCTSSEDESDLARFASRPDIQAVCERVALNKNEGISFNEEDIPLEFRGGKHRVTRIVKDLHAQYTWIVKKKKHPQPGESSEEEEGPYTSILCSPMQYPIPTTDANGRKLTKKAIKAAEQARHEAYAQYEFGFLNASVFDGRLPLNTKLEWSKRLLTTAGRASWKFRDGVHHTSIILSTKVLDDDERIANTLAHEMCHLACWVISNAPNENHGKIFKMWAKKVMDYRPEIEVTTKHDYEINYPYEWECQNCGFVYGRFSRSISTETSACRRCDGGLLKALFEVKTRTPRKPKVAAESRMAPATPRESPKPKGPSRSDVILDLTEVGSPTKGKRGVLALSRPNTGDSDSEVEEIVGKITGISLGA